MPPVAGLTVVLDWDDAKVKKGIADLNAMLGQIKIPGFGGGSGPGGGSGGGGSTFVKAPLNALEQLKKSVKETKAEFQSFLAGGGSAASQQGTRLASAYNAVNDQLQKVVKTTKGTQDAYARLSKVANEATRWAQNLGVTYGTTSKEFINASARAKNLTEKLKEVDAATGRNFRNVGNYTGSMAGLQNSFNQITREFPAFANSMQTGFMAISNNLPILVDNIKGLIAQNKALAASGQPTVSALRAIGAAIFSWGTALSLGVTLLTVYGKDIVNFIRGNESAAASVEALNAALEDNAVIDAKANMAQLKEEVKLAKDGHADAATVLGHFKDILGDAAKNVDTLGEAEEWLTKNADTFIRYQIAKAKATYAYAQAAKAAMDLENLQKNYGFFDVLKDDATKAGTVIKNLFNSIVEGDSRKIIDGSWLNTNTGRFPGLDNAKNNLDDLNKTAADATKEMNELLQQLNFNPYQDKSKKPKKDIKSIADVVKELNLQLDSTAVKLNAGVTNGSEAANERLTLLKRTIETLITDFKQTPENSALLEGYIADASMLSSVIDIAKRKIGELATPRLRDEGLSIGNIDLKPGQQLAKQAVDWAARVKNALAFGVKYVIRDGIQIPVSVAVTPEELDSATKDLADFKNAVGKTMQDVASGTLDAFASVFQNGGGFENFFGGMLDSIGKALKEFGKYLIQVGVIKELIDKALASLKAIGGGPLVVAAGLAAIAAGAALQSAAQKQGRNSFRAFADGGIVSGPTMGLVGEYANASTNPEVISPLSDLKNMLSDVAPTNVHVVGRIDGKDLALIMDRQNEYRNR